MPVSFRRLEKSRIGGFFTRIILFDPTSGIGEERIFASGAFGCEDGLRDRHLRWRGICICLGAVDHAAQQA